MISPERLESHQQSWARLLGSFGIAPGNAYPVFDRLVTSYSEPHRRYHNLEHVTEVLSVVGRLTDLAADVRAVRLAAWFHDAVYDPRSKDNEEKSAQLAESALGPLGVPADTLRAVTTLILATKHTGSSGAGADEAVLLDADLAILGSSEARYERYASAIREEYGWVDDEAYRAGRAAVLNHFLSLPRIYRTPRLFETGEEAARRNLRGELARLKS